MPRTTGPGRGSKVDRDMRRPVACTVDLTPDGATTLYHAAHMADLWKAPLVVLYAAQGPPVLAPRPAEPWTLGRDDAASVERELERFVSTHLPAPPRWTWQLMLGACPAQVVHRTRALRARALVVPARTSAGVGGLWWRGLAERLVPIAPCPLVVVPHGRGRGGPSSSTDAAGHEREIRDGNRGYRHPRPEHREEKVRDPVCGMRIEPGKAAVSSEHDGQMYFYCSPGCKERFDERPGDFAIAEEVEGQIGERPSP